MSWGVRSAGPANTGTLEVSPWRVSNGYSWESGKHDSFPLVSIAERPHNPLFLGVLYYTLGLHPWEITQNGSKITRFYPEMCKHGVNTQWVFESRV